MLTRDKNWSSVRAIAVLSVRLSVPLSVTLMHSIERTKPPVRFFTHRLHMAMSHKKVSLATANRSRVSICVITIVVSAVGVVAPEKKFPVV